MTTIPSAPPRISPVENQADRPFWSVMIPTYNCAKYLVKTLESVLAQDSGPAEMQIEVVDDVSTKDDPEAVVREIGKGRVRFHRHPANMGASRNFNACIQRARGHWVHILHGDDFVLPGFYEKMRRATESADVAMACCRAFVVDESDAIDSLSPRIGSLESPGRDVTAFCYNNPFLTPAVVIRRSIYEAEGGFREELIHVADWDMFVRAIRLGAGLAVNEPLASYRLFAANDTSRLMRTGENLRDYLRLSEVFAAAAADFDMARFRHAVASRARGQADAARERGDLEAAEANEKVWLELVPGDNANPKSAKWFLKQFIPPGLLGLSRFLQGANGSR